MDFINQQDLFRVGRDEILAQQSALTRDVIEREGSDANAIVACGSAIGDAVVGQVVAVSQASFLDSAENEDLDRLIFDRYQLTRKSASPAIGQVEFETDVGAPSTFVIPAGTALGTADGISFVTIFAVTYPVSAVGPVNAIVRSTVAGANQQARANTITSISGQITGAPTDLRVTNLLATAGAADVESNDQFRARARGYFPTVRRGTLSAVLQAALSAPGVRSASVFEDITPLNGRVVRAAELVVTDDYTDALVSLGISSNAYDTQSQAFAQSVFDALSDWRPLGTNVRVRVAQVVMQPIHLLLGFLAGADVESTSLRARATVVAYTNGLRPGQKWDRVSAQQAMKTVPGLAYTGQEITSPSGAVIPVPLQVIRSTMSICTVDTSQA